MADNRPKLNLLVKHGNVTEDDVVKTMIQVARAEKYSPEVQAILRTYPIADYPNRYDWLEKVFGLIRGISTYGNDTPGIEEVKTPKRFLFVDKFGDCDDYSTLWLAVLMNTKIPFMIKLVGYEKNGSWDHVYDIVPLKGSNDYVTLDNVNPKPFDNEVTYAKSKLYKVAV